MEAPPQPVRAESTGGAYVIVIGGGRVGYFLARALLENNVEVTVIESNKEIYDLITQQVDCPVILGDGSSTATLQVAGASRANVVVAVTNHDQDNLIACQIAKQSFGVPKTIARVKNPQNEHIMQQLGVDITVSSTSIITSAIQSELPQSRIRQVLDLHTGQLEIMEYSLDDRSPVVGKALRDVTLPAACNVISIFRGNEALVARGDTQLAAGDTVLALVQTPSEAELRHILLGD